MHNSAMPAVAKGNAARGIAGARPGEADRLRRQKAGADYLLANDSTLDPERFGRVAAASRAYGEWLRSLPPHGGQ